MNNRGESRGRGWAEGTPNSKIIFLLWAVFAAGLLVQMAAPRLKIENNMFVMPPITSGQQAALRPDALVRRERWMQFASGTLTVGGALALGVFYRRRLLGAIKG